jgi:large subunit ribosomal protein L25
LFSQRETGVGEKKERPCTIEPVILVGEEKLTEEITFSVTPRTIVGKKVKRIRREGWVPMVLYGPGSEPKLYQASTLEANRVMAAAGMTSLISLQVEGHQESHKTLVREVQRDVLSDALIHVDLYRVSMTQKITTEVPIELVGESPAVAQGQAMLLTLIDRLQIECLPGNLVSSLKLDLGPLENLDDVLHVKDLSVPKGIIVLADGDEVIVHLAHATRLEEEAEEEEEEMIPVSAAEVEVISRGKAEEEV